MSTLIDCRFAALRDKGHVGSTTDMLRTWLIAEGADPAILHINDLWLSMLDSKGFTGQYNDAWFALLGSLGYEGQINDREKDFWCIGGGDITPTLPPLPTNFGEMGALLAFDEVTDISMDGDLIVILGRQGAGGLLQVSNDGGASFTGGPIPDSGFVDIGQTITAVSYGADIYTVDTEALRANPVTAPWTYVYTDPVESIGHIAVSDSGNIVTGSGLGNVVIWNGSTWRTEIISTETNLSATAVSDLEWVICAYEGVAYHTTDLFDTPPTLLEAGLNSGDAGADIMSLSSNKDGVVVSVSRTGYSAYSLIHGVLGSWNPLPNWIGIPVFEYINEITIDDFGRILSVGSDGRTGYMELTDLVAWTQSSIPFGGTVFTTDSSDTGKFVIGYLNGQLAVSPPL